MAYDTRSLQELKQAQAKWADERARIQVRGPKHEPQPTTRDLRDWLDKLWEADNHRDPTQHTAMLRLQRNVTARQGLQDYFRQQRHQRLSKHEAIDPDQHMTDPNTVVDSTSDQLAVRDIEELLTIRQFKCLTLRIGGFSDTYISEQLHCRRDQIQTIVEEALTGIQNHFVDWS